ncbi:phage tail protein [Nonomuraea aridisoli]|uniref:Phage-related protein n=1 Tax=Nonomuraea aridisoli TaxID=2070368 RepID=A0A2W2E8I7_9ACTN|nr:hypothetical protein [Nonomuraea aridisoli]PZG20596.1 hypothetical protein C1J01_08820 [Nonomuraea aridisoli]
MAQARQVGRVSLRVMPDTKRFRRDLEDDLERLERALEVTVPAALDTSGLDRQARQAGVELERLGRRIGDELADGVERGLGDPVGDPLEESARRSRRSMPSEGDAAAGAFAQAFRRRIQTALSNLPEAEITADSSEADAKVQALRQALAELGDRRIGVDIQADTARAELAAIRGELASLAETAPVDVRMNTAAALAQLNAFEAELERLDRHVQVDVDVDVDRGRTEVQGLDGDASRAASGIRSAFSSAFTAMSSNVFVTVVAITAALLTLPLVGGAVATGLVVALGGGLAAIGIRAVAENKKVQKSFTDLQKHVSKELRRMAQPFVPALQSIARTARTTFDALSPHIEKAFTRIAPALARFAQQVGFAFERLGPAIGPLSDAFVRLLDTVGPQLPGLFEEIAAAITDVSNIISENPEMFAGFISGLIGLIPWAIEFVAVLSRIHVWFSDLGPLMERVATWFGELPGKIGSALSSFGSTVAGLFTGAWERVRTITTNAINNVVTFVRGLPGRARSAAAALPGQLGTLATTAWNRVRSFTSTGINNVLTFLRGLPGRARSAASALVGNLGTLATQAFTRMRSSASSGINNVLTVVRGIPGRIRTALGNLGNLLYSAGRNVIQGLINGIRSMVGQVGASMSNIAATIRSRLPFSPAKEGPLRTHPPDKAGRTIARMLADGMSVGERLVARAANGLAGAALPNLDGQLQTAAGGGRGQLGGGLTVHNYYPQAEPTSRTTNRTLQYAAALGMLG